MGRSEVEQGGCLGWRQHGEGVPHPSSGVRAVLGMALPGHRVAIAPRFPKGFSRRARGNRRTCVQAPVRGASLPVLRPRGNARRPHASGCRRVPWRPCSHRVGVPFPPRRSWPFRPRLAGSGRRGALRFVALLLRAHEGGGNGHIHGAFVPDRRLADHGRPRHRHRGRRGDGRVPACRLGLDVRLFEQAQRPNGRLRRAVRSGRRVRAGTGIPFLSAAARRGSGRGRFAFGSCSCGLYFGAVQSLASA